MKVQELLADPKCWTQGEIARDKDGKCVDVNSPHAVCWCLSGAIIKCYGLRSSVHTRVSNHIATRFTTWNDAPERTHADVLQLCKELDI